MKALTEAMVCSWLMLGFALYSEYAGHAERAQALWVGWALFLSVRLMMKHIDQRDG